MPVAYRLARGEYFEDLIIDIYTGVPIKKLNGDNRYAVIRKLISKTDMVISPDSDVSQLAVHGDFEYFSNDLIVGGRHINRFDILGRFIVCNSDLHTALSKAEMLLNLCEEQLRIPLLHPKHS